MNKITDDMKTIIKLPLTLTIVSAFLLIVVIVCSIVFKLNMLEEETLLKLIPLVFLLLLSIFLLIHTINYKVEIDEEKVFLKSTFKEVVINLCNVEKYTCVRFNKKSDFFQFDLYVNGKPTIVYTRYKDAFQKILADKNIPLVVL